MSIYYLFGGFDIAVIAFHYQMHRSDSVFRLYTVSYFNDVSLFIFRTKYHLLVYYTTQHICYLEYLYTDDKIMAQQFIHDFISPFLSRGKRFDEQCIRNIIAHLYPPRVKTRKGKNIYGVGWRWERRRRGRVARWPAAPIYNMSLISLAIILRLIPIWRQCGRMVYMVRWISAY